MFTAEVTDLITWAAKNAGFEPAALMAIIDVESGGRTHAVVGARREPLIRFEAHFFDRRLSPTAREVARHEGLAAPTAGAIRNPPGQAARWRMLERAAEIDRRAAYESTSWGVGQVMGAHWAWLGYESVEALVKEARAGLAGQLRLMLRYIDKAGLAEALRCRDWTAFARGYNGPGYARNSYHLRLALSYRRHARRLTAPMRGTRKTESDAILLRRGDRGEAVRRLQRQLTLAGYPVEADGTFGARTYEALRAFQSHRGLAADGIAGPLTMEALQEQLPPDSRIPEMDGILAALWRKLSGFLARLAI